MLYALKVAHKAACQTLSKTFLNVVEVLLVLEVPLAQYPEG